MKRYVAVLDNNTGLYYGKEFEELVIEDDTGKSLIRFEDNSKMICNSNLLFETAEEMYNKIYELNKL